MKTLTLTTTFESSEHQSLGDLKLPGLPQDKQKLMMPNGIELSFGDICALAGDYFAVAKKPISFGKDEKDRKDRFLNAYETLAYSKRRKVRKILKIIEGQTKAINDAMSQGKPEYTGAHIKFKEMLKVLVSTKFNIVGVFEMAFDHMENNAMIAHHVGHTLAREAAARAHYINNPREQQAQLAYAYSLEAFACHFLTDHFASGHLRTPSSALYFEFGAEIGALLGILMHKEDNNIGLNVANENGDIWKAYGDAHLFESYNKKTRELAINALNIVINEVYKAFESGIAPTNEYSAAYKLLPKPMPNNPSPMFIDDAETMRLYYRANLDNIDCNEYKKLKRIKIPYILFHFITRSIKNNLKIQKEISQPQPSVEEKGKKQLQHPSNSLKDFSLFSPTQKQNYTPASINELNTPRIFYKK